MTSPDPGQRLGSAGATWAPLLCRSHLIFSADSGCGNLCLHLFKSMEIKESRPTQPSTPTSARLLSPPPLYFRHWIHPILSVGPLTSHPLEPQGSQTCLQPSKIVLTTPRISHVFYMFIKTSSIHQVNGTVLFFFLSQNRRRETQQLFPGLAKPGEGLHHL